MANHAYVCHPQFESELIAEMRHLATLKTRRRAPHFSVLTPGVVLQHDGSLLDPAFARQVLPAYRKIEATHREELVQKIFASFPDNLRDSEKDWSPNLFVFPPDTERKGSEAFPRHFYADLAEELQIALRLKIQGRSLKMQRKGGTEPDDLTVQVLVTAPNMALVATAPTSRNRILKSWPVPFPGGRAHIEQFLDAPSSAHRKLQEALRWMELDFQPVDVVMDAGAAPGGWSYLALARGAQVYAIDRGKMDPVLATDANLHHLRKDAFSTLPPERITFLLCDIIEEPGRVLNWLKESALREPLRAFVVTLKLKKPLNFRILDDARSWAENHLDGWHWRIKNLKNNKMEVSFMAHCGESEI